VTLTPGKIDQLISDISIAALKSWLKSHGHDKLGNSREELVARIVKLVSAGELTSEQLKTGICNIEEASAKRSFLFKLSDGAKIFNDPGPFAEHLKNIGKELSSTPKLAPRRPTKPKLVYITWSPKFIRAKWAETHTKVIAEKTILNFEKEDVTRVVVLLMDLATRHVEIRYDKPEDKNWHDDSKERYFAYYRAEASALLGGDLVKFEIREALRSLVEEEPRIVRIRVSSHRSRTDKAVKFVARTAKTDVRDDHEWEAAYGVGEDSRAYDDQSVYWLPTQSNGALTREVFSAIDAVTSMIRVEADCHEGEIDYAVSKVREHQGKKATLSKAS
jgi:hypothetical protein